MVWEVWEKVLLFFDFGSVYWNMKGFYGGDKLIILIQWKNWQIN